MAAALVQLTSFVDALDVLMGQEDLSFTATHKKIIRIGLTITPTN
jgi:hypothetical protein